MAYYNRYQYETSPRKLQPEYKPVKKKYPKKSTARKAETTKKQVAKPKTKVKRKMKSQAKVVLYIAVVFGILFAISYRNSLINEDFSKIKSLKSDLAAIQKENGQLQVNIENSLNLQNVEQSAKELLGMQKLNSSQSVYINLPKQDYIEPATEEIKKEEHITWYQKIFNLILGK